MTALVGDVHLIGVAKGLALEIIRVEVEPVGGARRRQVKSWRFWKGER